MPDLTLPVAIPSRPYAIFPPTNLMNPDGFFITNLGMQFIEAHIVNESENTLRTLTVYIEGFSDPGVQPFLEYQRLGDVPPHARVPVRFLVDFANGSPGMKLVSFIVEGDGFEFSRVIKKIFVTRLEFDKPSKTVIVHAPEGRMLVKVDRAIVDRKHGRCCAKVDPKGPHVFLPTRISYEWIPDPSYAGKHGSLPYEDPWWKALVWVAVFLIVLGAALLYDYFSDGTLDGGSVSVSGGDIPPAPEDYTSATDDATFCCEEITSKIPQKTDNISVGASGYGDWIEKGLYAAAGPIATGVAYLADDEDPHYRGQKNTTPLESEFTVSEKVKAIIDYPEPPSLGKNYRVNGKWEYTRKTSGNNYKFNMEETRTNTHFLKSYDVRAPALHDRHAGPLRILARFQKRDGKHYYRGDELYVFGVLVSTYGAVRKFQMKDHGVELDSKANDGWYTGGYTFATKIQGKPGQSAVDDDLPGDWYLFVFAQDVNTVPEGTDPILAAKVIGGVVLTSQMRLSFDEPCTLEHDAVIHVI